MLKGFHYQVLKLKKNPHRSLTPQSLYRNKFYFKMHVLFYAEPDVCLNFFFTPIKRTLISGQHFESPHLIIIRLTEGRYTNTLQCLVI